MPSDNHLIDASTYLRQLCQSISQAKLQYRGIELLFREFPLKLGATRCWRMGMIISELIANAARHAFQDAGGRIVVELSSCGGLVECIVTDSGSPPENARPGQGSKIVRALAGDLNGSIEHLFGSRGTMVTLSFPLLEPDHAGACEVRTNSGSITLL